MKVGRVAKKKIGASAEEASRKKSKKYNDNYEMHTAAGKNAGTLVPLAFETSGAMDSKTHEWVCEMARRSRGVDSKGEYAMRVLDIMQRLSVAVQRGNARMIRHWRASAFPPPPPQGQAAAGAAAQGPVPPAPVPVAGGAPGGQPAAQPAVVG